MPLYDYRCDRCGEFEAWRTLAESSLPSLCPTCEISAKRIIMAPNLNLNSSGFSLRRPEMKEPRLIKRDGESKPSRNQAAHGRPWMISHE